MKTQTESMEERTGLRSLELVYRPVFDWDEQCRVCYQSQLRINGANMGILLPWQYLPVAERTDQCCQLAKWGVEQACSDIAALEKRGVEFEWISVYVSLRLLAEEAFAVFVQELLGKQDAAPEQLCIEVPVVLLSCRDLRVADTISRLKALGIHFLLSGFGAVDCPVMQLAQTSVDLVQLDPTVSQFLVREQPDNREHAAACSLVSFVQGQGVELVADGIGTRVQAEAAAKRGCNRTTGEFAGGYLRKRGIRAERVC